MHVSPRGERASEGGKVKPELSPHSRWQNSCTAGLWFYFWIQPSHRRDPPLHPQHQWPTLGPIQTQLVGTSAGGQPPGSQHTRETHRYFTDNKKKSFVCMSIEIIYIPIIFYIYLFQSSVLAAGPYTLDGYVHLITAGCWPVPWAEALLPARVVPEVHSPIATLAPCRAIQLPILHLLGV